MHAFTLANSFSLFFAMLALAAIPGLSVIIVTTRAATLGMAHGVYAILGIVVGDVLFILLAIFGLSLIYQALGENVVWFKWIAAGYLLWLALALWRQDLTRRSDWVSNPKAGFDSFTAGLVITLGDQKAIVFYLGFLPAFVDLKTITPQDTVLLVLIASIAIGLAKLPYAYLAVKSQQLSNTSTLARYLPKIAALVLFIVAALLLF